MSNDKNLTIEEIFNIAATKHSQNEIKEAQELYNKILEVNPNYSLAINNLGVIFEQIEDHQKAIDCYKKAIEINSSFPDAHNNLGVIFKKLGDNKKAIDCYKKAIEINPNYFNAHNNLGVIFLQTGDFQKAMDCYEKAIKINSNYAEAYYNLGNLSLELYKNQKAKDCYEKAIKINPNYVDAYWNLQSIVSNVDEALLILKKLYKIDNKYTKAKIMISALEGYKGNFIYFDEILNSSDSNHPITRSIKWVFSLPKLPMIFFNRWDFFDNLIKLSNNLRPFYEFGVWHGLSFGYLIKTFKKGFGFDTFTGIPENWHNEPKGTYSAYGRVPKINGGEFIVGKFEDTLPDFFSKKKPIASLINFDADLYSSTLCALNYSNKVIDEKTILIFDEFLINDKWEQDEFKALNEFCDNLGYSYEVIAISFLTKQVAVKLKKK